MKCEGTRLSHAYKELYFHHQNTTFPRPFYFFFLNIYQISFSAFLLFLPDLH